MRARYYIMFWYDMSINIYMSIFYNGKIMLVIDKYNDMLLPMRAHYFTLAASNGGADAYRISLNIPKVSSIEWP